MKRDRLTDLLREWSERHAPSGADAEQMARRIGQELSRRPVSLLHGPVPTSQAFGRRSRLTWAALGAAAAALIGIGVAVLASRRAHTNGGGAELAALSDADIAERARLFHEIEGLFAADLRWVVHTDSDLRLNVAPAVGRPATHATPILVRVVVLSRTTQQRTWRKLLATDVMAPSEELVEATPDPATGNRLTLWAYPLPDGKVAVDSRIRLSTPILASADLSTVVTPGEPVQVLALRSEGTEYRVFEMVVPLPKARGASCSGI